MAWYKDQDTILRLRVTKLVTQFEREMRMEKSSQSAILASKKNHQMLGAWLLHLDKIMQKYFQIVYF